MKKYLVTGGAGFIGVNFIRHMFAAHDDIHITNLDALTYAGNSDNLSDIAQDARYRFVHGDIGDADLVSKLFDDENIDIVVNFAAESHVDNSINSPAIFAKTNILGTVVLLDAARRAWQAGDDQYREGVRFLQVSTDEVYGTLGAEGLFTEESPIDPHSPYSASKAGADHFVRAYFDTFRLPVNITRCSNNYGPYQYPEKLISLMICNALRHKALPVYGDGMQVRDWLYVEDHCRAIDLVLQKGVLGEIYNIGGNNERFNIDIVKKIVHYIHHHEDAGVGDHLIQHVTDRKGHDRRYAIDASKIQAQLGFAPSVGFDEGIERTIRWYLDHKDFFDL